MKNLLLIFSLLVGYGIGFADSPLTSTDFYRAYLDEPIVKKAADNPKQLTDEEMAYLFDDSNPLDIRLALINAIGFDPEKRLMTIMDYQSYITSNIDRKKYNLPEDKIITMDDIVSRVSPDQMAILTYMAALANHFNMMFAYNYAEQSMQNPVSKQSFMFPMAIVWAQLKFDMGEWDAIYPTMEYLFLNTEEKDMRPEAVEIIMDYINLYKN